MTQKNLPRILIGGALIAIGLGLLGSAFGFWDFNLFFDGWWTLFLIVPALASIFSGGFSTGNVILLIIGASLLMRERNILPGIFTFRFILAVALICVGAGYILGRTRRNRPYDTSGEADNFDYPNYFVMFGALDLRNTCRDLKGGRFTAVFGGLDIDLRDARLRQDITVYATALFGGIEIRPPGNAAVRANGIPLFGGFSDDSAKIHAEEPLYTMTVNYTALFGGVEVK